MTSKAVSYPNFQSKCLSFIFGSQKGILIQISTGRRCGDVSGLSHQSMRYILGLESWKACLERQQFILKNRRVRLFHSVFRYSRTWQYPVEVYPSTQEWGPVSIISPLSLQRCNRADFQGIQHPRLQFLREGGGGIPLCRHRQHPPSFDFYRSLKFQIIKPH